MSGQGFFEALLWYDNQTLLFFWKKNPMFFKGYSNVFQKYSNVFQEVLKNACMNPTEVCTKLGVSSTILVKQAPVQIWFDCT